MQLSTIGGVLHSGVVLGVRLLGGIRRAFAGLPQVAFADSNAVSLNGTSEYMASNVGGAVGFSASYTQMGWVKVSAFAGGGAFTVVLDVDDNDTVSTNRAALGFDGSDQPWCICFDGSANSATAAGSAAGPTGEWVQLVAVKDGTTSLKIYMNGVLIATDSTSVPDTSSSDADRAIAVGVQINGGAFSLAHVNGDIHSSAIWSNALSANEVIEIFNQGAGSMMDLSRDEGDYTSSATLIHWWRIGQDTGATGRDSGTGTPVDIGDGATVGASAFIRSAPDSAYIDFDGSTEYLFNSTAQAYDVGASWAVAMWIQATTISGTQIAFNMSDAAGSEKDRITLYSNSSNQWTARWGDASSTVQEASSGVTNIADVWYHVAAVKNGTTSVKLYVNGEEVAENTTTITTSTDSTNRILAIAANSLTAGNSKFACLFHSAALWDAAITEAELQDLYNGGHKDFDLSAAGVAGGYASEANLKHWWRAKPTGSVGVGSTYVCDFVSSGGIDLSANDVGVADADLFVQGTDQVAGSGVSVDLDGTAEFFANTTENAIGIADAWSVSVWYRPAALTATMTVLELVPASPFESQIKIEVRGTETNDPVEVFIRDSTGTIIKNYDWASIHTAGTWIHLLLTWDGTTLKLFIDGTSVAASTKTTDGTGTMDDAVRKVHIGADQALGSFFSGNIGHVAVWNVVLGTAAARQLARAGHKANLTSWFGAYASQLSLQHWWKLGEDPDDLGKDYTLKGTAIDVDANAASIAHEPDIRGDAP